MAHFTHAFDCDGHVRETNEELSRYYEGTYKNLRRPTTHPIFPALDGWFRGSFVRLYDAERKYMHTDAAVWGKILDTLHLEEFLTNPALPKPVKESMAADNAKRFYRIRSRSAVESA